jgi:hypothetical protein
VSVEEINSIGNLHKRALERRIMHSPSDRFAFGSIDGWKGEVS